MPEIANGHDADIDNPEASPPKPSPLPPTPPSRPSPSNQGRSGSPDQPTSLPPAIDRRINGKKEDRLTHALPPIPQVPPPPASPLSPHRSSFPSHGELCPLLSVPLDRHRSARSGLDAGAEPELSSRIDDLHPESSYHLQNGTLRQRDLALSILVVESSADGSSVSIDDGLDGRSELVNLGPASLTKFVRDCWKLPSQRASFQSRRSPWSGRRQRQDISFQLHFLFVLLLKLIGHCGPVGILYSNRQIVFLVITS